MIILLQTTTAMLLVLENLIVVIIYAFLIRGRLYGSLISRSFKRKVELLKPIMAAYYIASKSIFDTLQVMFSYDFLRDVFKKGSIALMNVFLTWQKDIKNIDNMPWLIRELMEITNDPYHFLSNIDSYYISLIQELDNRKIAYEQLDEFFSIIIFLSFFFPIVLIFLILKGDSLSFLIATLYPLLNLSLLYVMGLKYVKSFGEK